MGSPDSGPETKRNTKGQRLKGEKEMKSMIRPTLWMFLTIVAASSWTTNAFASPATPISSCGTVITVSGNYFLSSDLSCPGTTAVMIAASKVDLDLRGHTIDGVGGSGFGISTSSSQMSSTGDLSLCLAVTSIHIHGGTVRGYSAGGGTGIILCSPNPPPGPSIAMSVQVENMVLTSNEIGLELISSGKNKIANNFVSYNSEGVSLANGCANNNITGNLLDGNGAGMVLEGPNNTADSNVSINNTQGIFVSQVAVNTQTTNNYTSHNSIGILAEQASAGNVFKGNTSFANTSFDLEDDNGNCTNNSWTSDFFGTSSPACIQ
jgi:copper-binding protein NosD